MAFGSAGAHAPRRQGVDIFHFGRSHTNGDSVVLFRADRVLAAGDMFTFGDATPELIDYAGGGSGKEWTARSTPR